MITYDTFCVDFYDENTTLQNLKQRIQPNTKMVICTHASNVLGIVLPIEKIGKLCYRNHIIFCVDAAQTAGILPINMGKMHINFLCVAPHKGLFAPMGIGMLLSDGTKISPLIEGGTGSASALPVQPEDMPERLESGTVNVNGIIGIGAGIDYINRVSLDVIHQKEKRLVLHVYEALSGDSRLRFYCDYSRCGEISNAISLSAYHYSSEELCQMLGDCGIAVRGGLHCAPLAHKKIGTVDTGTLRISPSVFTMNDEINYAISTIKNMI